MVSARISDVSDEFCGSGDRFVYFFLRDYWELVGRSIHIPDFIRNAMVGKNIECWNFHFHNFQNFSESDTFWNFLKINSEFWNFLKITKMKIPALNIFSQHSISYEVWDMYRPTGQLPIVTEKNDTNLSEFSENFRKFQNSRTFSENSVQRLLACIVDCSHLLGDPRWNVWWSEGDHSARDSGFVQQNFRIFPKFSECFRKFWNLLKIDLGISWPTGTRLAPLPSWRRLPWDCSTTIESNCYLISNRKLSENSDFSENSEKFWNPPAEQSPEGGACTTAEIRFL